MNAANKTGLTPYDLAMGKGGGPAGRQPPKEVTAALLQKLGGSADDNTSREGGVENSMHKSSKKNPVGRRNFPERRCRGAAALVANPPE